jgi:sensor histidine kinase YesM
LSRHSIRAYLEIEAERFEERLRFAIEAPEETREVLIPPMLLRRLVENAVERGIS